MAGGEGAEIVYSLKNDSTLAQKVLDNIGEQGQIKRKIYQRRLPENPNKDYYYILRETGDLEPILVEYGFIDNKNDAYKLKNNLDDYAEGVVKAVAEYAGYDYFAPGDIPSNEDIYIVKKGDTLYSIARDNNISVDKLKELNNLTSNTLSIGQKLYITDSNTPDNGEQEENPNLNKKIYIVKRGDTLYSIARDNNISVDKLKELNNLTNNTLSIGQKLILSEEQLPDNGNDEYDIYTVKRGDSLWSISQKYNITVKELIDLNNLDDLTLQINQQLKVPKSNDTEENFEETYIVKRGDTLWSISKEFDIPVNELKELNNLTSNLLSIGQEIKVKKI